MAAAAAVGGKVSLQIIRGKELEERGMGGLWNVGKASEHPPSLAVCRHSPPRRLAHSENSETESCTERCSSRFKNNCLAEMWSGSEEGSCLRLIDSCTTQL